MNPKCMYCNKEMKKVETSVSFLGNEHTDGYICMGTLRDPHYHWKKGIE